MSEAIVMKKLVALLLAVGLAAAAVVFVDGSQLAQTEDDLQKSVGDVVKKGLRFLTKAQHTDGHWEANEEPIPSP